jgi:trimethylamine--corrinoid protein Co-methyltransferase
MQVKPKLQLLDPEQIHRIHKSSIRILEDVGIQVESETALGIFAKSDGVKIKDHIVYLGGELVNHAIGLAPSKIAVFNKKGKHEFHLGSNQAYETRFGIGATNTWFQGIDEKEIVLFTRQHMRHSTKLGDILENYDLISTLGIPSDVPVDKLDLYATLDQYANTDKPLVLLISGEGKIHEVFDLLTTLHGDISSRPFCIPYVNPITPLVMNRSTTDKMLASIDYDLPIIYSNYGMCGGTTPIAEAGTLALLNAELLAGLTFSQLRKEGSPIVLGSLPAAFNMSNMGSCYTPGSYLMNLACAEMMDFYNIPHCGTSGSNNGRGADLIASGNFWLNHLSSCLGKIGCVPFVGGNFDSTVFSPTSVVLSDQIIADARRFTRGFPLDEKALQLHEIREAGHGGNYLTSEQTLSALEESGNSDCFWSSLDLDSWKQKQMPSAEQELIQFTKELYSAAIKKSEEGQEIIKMGDSYIESK